MRKEIALDTAKKEGLHNITQQVQSVVTESGVTNGICTVFVPHTTAGVTINEGADPDVALDIITGLRTLVPENLPYRHAEGNSPAHLRASLLGSSVQIIVQDGRLQLGTWQAIFFGEFDGPRKRRVWVHVGS